jgi:hypothetical protein
MGLECSGICQKCSIYKDYTNINYPQIHAKDWKRIHGNRKAIAQVIAEWLIGAALAVLIIGPYMITAIAANK